MTLSGGLFGLAAAEEARFSEQRNADIRREAIEKLQALQYAGDPEATHADADKVICDLLIALDFEDVVEEWKAVPKWYA